MLKFKFLESTPTTKVILDTLEGLYGLPQRYYHTMHHVQYMVEFFEYTVKNQERLNLLGLAAYFHDAIYITDSSGRGSGEYESAELAYALLSQVGLSPKYIRNVQDLIMLTKGHHLDLAETKTEKLMIAADLWALGSSYENYELVAQLIRNEYSEYSDEEFVVGRRSFLEDFLSRKRILPSLDKGFDRQNTRAFNNLSREYDQLCQK